MPVPKELYRQSNVTLMVLCLLYTACYVIHGTVSGMPEVSRLEPGLWFSWQPFVVVLIAVAAVFEMREPRDETAAKYHSTTIFSARRRASISAYTVWGRTFGALSLVAVDLTYLAIKGVHCLSLDCVATPAAQCCAEGTLFGVALAAVAVQVLLGVTILYLCVRLPLLPSFYLHDPLDADIDDDEKNGYTSSSDKARGSVMTSAKASNSSLFDPDQMMRSIG